MSSGRGFPGIRRFFEGILGWFRRPLGVVITGRGFSVLIAMSSTCGWYTPAFSKHICFFIHLVFMAFMRMYVFLYTEPVPGIKTAVAFRKKAFEKLYIEDICRTFDDQWHFRIMQALREHERVLKMKRKRYNAWMPFDFLCKNRQKQWPQITKHYDFFTQTFALLTFPETIIFIVLSTN